MFKALLFAGLILSVAAAHSATILVVGDSISAGYGLPDPRDGWVALLARDLNGRGDQVVNAGVSGDTTAGGLSRLPKLLERYKPQVVVIELGGNDGLRGIGLSEMEHNLRELVGISREAGAAPVLLGMQMPPNYGRKFAMLFEAVYPRIAKDLHVEWVEGFLRGIGDVPDLMQSDQVHPNEKAQVILKDKVLKSLISVLKR
jgi:acyl-CoA thioesterase-1